MEKVLVYLGPSLPRDEALQYIPEAIILPPAKQGDVVSDYHIHQPTHILLIDGVFHSNLSVWHKELVFCLHEGVNVYGSSSMGAIRAADLWRVGMRGYGQVFDWYKSGAITDDSEVALLHTGEYWQLTVPLVNVRATLQDAPGLIAKAAGIQYASRTLRALKSIGIDPDAWVDIKRQDAEGLLQNFRDLPSEATGHLTGHCLSHLFHAMNERDRRVMVKGNPVPLQHIDAHFCLNEPTYSESLWGSNNRSLAIILADIFQVHVTAGEVQDELMRFARRNSITDAEKYLKDNNLSEKEAAELLKQNARIRKLHKALDSSRMRRRGTQPLLDHLRTHNKYSEVAAATPITDEISLQVSDLAKPNLDTESTLEDFISECGFSTMAELSAALKIECKI